MSKSSFPLRPLLRALLPLALALPMAGCLATGGYAYRTHSVYGYGDPGYVTRYSSYSDAPYTYSRPYSSFWTGSTWYGGHYGSSRYCDYDNPVFRSSSKTSGPKTLVKMVDYNERYHRNIPSGYHTKDWWQDNGFSLKSNTFKTTTGDYRGKVPSHSSSSSHSKSSHGKSGGGKMEKD